MRVFRKNLYLLFLHLLFIKDTNVREHTKLEKGKVKFTNLDQNIVKELKNINPPNFFISHESFLYFCANTVLYYFWHISQHCI